MKKCHVNSTKPYTPFLILLLTLQLPVTHSSTACLTYHGCYGDLLLHLNHSTTYHSYRSSRKAETCANLCLQKLPHTKVVLVKLVSVDELLSCGCGSELVLAGGSYSGSGGCYLCPDGLNEECGSGRSYSIYKIKKLPSYNKGDYCRKLLTIPTTTTTTTTTTKPEVVADPLLTTTNTTLAPNSSISLRSLPNSLSNTSNSAPNLSDPTSYGNDSSVSSQISTHSLPNYSNSTTNFSHDSNYHPNSSNDPNYIINTSNDSNNNNNFSSDSNYSNNSSNGPNDPISSNDTNYDNYNLTITRGSGPNYGTLQPRFRELGCYNEDLVNQSQVVTMVVSGSYNGVRSVSYCASNCSSAHPNSDVFLLKLLSTEEVYCGCGIRSALPSMSGGESYNTTKSSGQCDMRCGEGQTSLPCGGWTAVSAYHTNTASIISASFCCLFITHAVMLLLTVYLACYM